MWHRSKQINRPFTILGFIVLGASIFFFCRTVVANPLSADSYTHVAVGRFVIAEKKVPTAGDLSFKVSAPSLEWVTHSWLSDVILYLAGSVHPTFGAAVLLLPLFALSLFLTHHVLQTLRIPGEIELIVLSLATILAASFWKLHPIVFAIPLLLTLNILLVTDLSDRRMYWGIPIIFLLFANLAGGYILIPLVFFLLMMPWKFLPFIFLVSNIATAVSPIGLRLWGYPITLVTLLYSVRSASSLPGSIVSVNQNFLKSAPSSVMETIFLIYSIALLFMLIAALVNRRQDFLRKYGRTLPLLFFLSLGFFWVRFIPLATLGSMPLFAVLVPKNKVIPVILLILIGYLLWRPPLPLRIDLPQKQVELIKQFALPSTILTSFDYTGYVLYSLPEQKVALDAQDDLFDEHALVSIYSWPVSVTPDTVRQITNRYGVNTILVSKHVGGLATSLTQNPDWALIYFDTSGFLFVKKSSVTADFLDANALNYIDLTRNLGADPAHIPEAIKELETFTKKYPESVLALGQLASLYRVTNTYTQAEDALNRIPRARWDYTVFTEMGRIKAAEGLCVPAKENFLSALSDRSEQNYSRTVLDLAVLWAGCFGDTKEAKHYFVRYNSFLLTPPEREKLRQLMKTFDISLE